MNFEPESDVQHAVAPADPSWSSLVQRIQAGDAAGMEEMYAIFSKGVRFYLWRQLGSQDLDDKVHDIFLIITQSIQRGELREPERLMGYVRTITRRQVAAHIDAAIHTRNGRAFDYRRGVLRFVVGSRVHDIGVYRPKHQWRFDGGIAFREIDNRKRNVPAPIAEYLRENEAKPKKKS